MGLSGWAIAGTSVALLTTVAAGAGVAAIQISEQAQGGVRAPSGARGAGVSGGPQTPVVVLYRQN